MSSPSSHWAVWSRRPRDPTNAPALIISPRTNPPPHIYQYALSDQTPPPSPEPTRTPTPEPESEPEPDPTPTPPVSPPPPQKKSWASLLQPSPGSRKNQLPTSSIVGFSVPASSLTPTISPSKKAALTSLLKNDPPQTPIRVHPRGLTNTGNMCFANSVLQVLLYCEPFWNMFIQLGELLPEGEEEHALARATADFIRDFLPMEDRRKGKERAVEKEDEEWDEAEEAEAFIPTYVYDALRTKKRFDGLVGGGVIGQGQGQEDAEEFLGFYLDTLEEELLALGDDKTTMTAATTTAKPTVMEQHTEQEQPVGDGWLEVGKKNRTVVTRTIKSLHSPISRLFGGKFRSTLRAPGQRDSVIIEDWRSLRLDIQPDDIHTIQDAISHISHPQPVQMDVRGSTIEASQQVLIDALPPVLVVHLKRFCYDVTVGGVMKVSKQITFGEELVISGDVLSPTAKSRHRSTRYKLFGVIYHHGISASGGHYTLDVLHTNRFPAKEQQPGQGWIRIDDQLVSDIQHADVFASAAFERDDAASRCAYMLFYKRV
ncbi:ubiquitin c-terminal hydrolase [Moniliophthora roreri MCA 2997]|uniref:Ubiquitin carboxyl-terminal hydrolase n=1 Tax=Moniliophthora roreri (strain MCA 2997) TaxID=1381753 RepID=V2XGE8_MONRO|nr:ubiquitin c-terminal hydrolase [Moniliophthora roreri MCA 2997]